MHVIIGGKGQPGAMQLTKRADKGNITSSLKEEAAAVAKRLRNTGKLKSVSGKQFRAYVRYELQRRIKSIGYTAGPGWHNAAKAFGGKGVRVQKGFPKSKASKGKGRKATAASLVAELENTAPAAMAMGYEALQQAITNTAKDMIEYWTRKAQANFDKVNAR